MLFERLFRKIGKKWKAADKAGESDMRINCLVFAAIFFLLVVPAAAMQCKSDLDCRGEDYCSEDARICVPKHFVKISPTLVKAQVGDQIIFTVTVEEPVNQMRSYRLEIAPYDVAGCNAKYLARFFSSFSEMEIKLKPGEVKKVPVYVTANAAGTYNLCIHATDTVYSDPPPKGIGSERNWPESIAHIETDFQRGGAVFVSVPGPGFYWFFALALISSLYLAFFREVVGF